MEMKYTFLNRRLDLKASRIEAFVLPKVDFPLSLLCFTVHELATPTNFNCSRICEIILRTFVGVAERNKNRSKYGRCSASIVLMHDNAMVTTFTKQKTDKACYYDSIWLQSKFQEKRMKEKKNESEGCASVFDTTEKSVS